MCVRERVAGERTREGETVSAIPGGVGVGGGVFCE